MFNFRNLFLATSCLIFISCYKKYIGTRTICENDLYLEIYEINPAGIDACYVTDSTNFRIYVGKFDPESGNYKFRCKGDILYIEKFKERDEYISDTVNIVIEKRLLNLRVLKHQRKFE